MIAFFTAGRAPASQRIAVSAALTLMASTGGPLSAATLGKDGTFSYNVASVPLLAEAVKLLVSVICLILADSCEGDTRCSPFSDKSTGGDSVDSESFTCSRDGGKPHDGSTAIRNKLREDLRQTTWRSALVYFPPSMLFIVINNLRIWNMRYIDPASAELLGALRIALTAVMLRCFLRRSFTRTQWASVALLYFSVGLSQMDGASLKHIGDPRVRMKRRRCVISKSVFYSSASSFSHRLRFIDSPEKVCQVSTLTFSFLPNYNTNRAHINNRDTWAWHSWLAARLQPLFTWSGHSRGASPHRYTPKTRRSTAGGSCSTAPCTSRHQQDP